MVMKKSSRQTVSPPASSVRRLGVAEAKARLSEILRVIEDSPVVIQSRGRDVGVLIDVRTFARIAETERPGGAAFLAAVAALRQRFGGVEGFEPPPADFAPQEPFRNRTRR
jgi:prevent-host-death family protein